MVDFDAISRDLISRGLHYEHPKPQRFTFPDTQNLLRRGLAWAVGEDYKWLKPYEEVADWMSDTKNKGLMLMGSCGQGKTIIAQQILPIVFNAYAHKVFGCYDSVFLARNPDVVLQDHLVMIDDVGTENISVNYGERRCAFAELVDLAEKKGKLLLLTTNLDSSELAQRYGDRIIDRLKQLCRCVVFKGKSMRN